MRRVSSLTSGELTGTEMPLVQRRLMGLGPCTSDKNPRRRGRRCTKDLGIVGRRDGSLALRAGISPDRDGVMGAVGGYRNANGSRIGHVTVPKVAD